MLGLVLKAVDADDAAVSAAACGVVAAATANDAEVQNGAGQAAVDALLGAWRRSAAREDDGWGRRALHALCATTRNAPMEKKYVERHACDVLKYALLRSATKDGARLAAKAAFALHAATRHLEAPPLFADDVAADAARRQLREHCARAVARAGPPKRAEQCAAAAKRFLGDAARAAACEAEGVADALAVLEGRES